MKAAVFVMALTLATPAHAQLGGILNKAQKAKKTADKIADWNINDQEERQLGEQVSAKLREKFGVFQDANVTKYVALVGGVVAQQSTRPNLPWTFIVLDTDGVNAFAAPGGIIHVTHGLLGLCRNEAELAGVLGHEITHVTEKHTVNAIKQGKTISIASDAAGSGSARNAFLSQIAERAYHTILDGEFSRKDEGESDQVGVRVVSKVGYAPTGLVDVLKKIDARNNGREERNGLFASHPATKDRIETLQKQIASEKLSGTATAASRYAKNITFEAKPITQVAMSVEGAAGLAGGSSAKAEPAKDEKKEEKKDDKPAEQPKKKGFGLGSLTSGLTKGKQAESTQASASAGGRMMNPDRDAKGGPNKNIVPVTVTAAELENFRKGITA